VSGDLKYQKKILAGLAVQLELFITEEWLCLYPVVTQNLVSLSLYRPVRKKLKSRPLAPIRTEACHCVKSVPQKAPLLSDDSAPGAFFSKGIIQEVFRVHISLIVRLNS
jgi:hypothetical protein